MKLPKVAKYSLVSVGVFVGLIAALVLFRLGRVTWQELTKSDEERQAEKEHESSMEDHLEDLAESGNLGGEGPSMVLPQGMTNLSGDDMPSLDDLNIGQVPGLPPGVHPQQSTPSPSDTCLELHIDATGQANLGGQQMDEDALREYLSVIPNSTTAIVTVDSQCDNADADRWLEICEQAGISTRVAQESDEIRR